jgi:carboxyl-terminal processing protease
LTRAYEAAERKLKNATTVVKTTDVLTADLKKDLSLTIQRAGEKLSMQMKLSTADTIIGPISHRMLAEGIGYLDIEFFINNSPEEVAAALSELAEQGATKLTLDLRDCPGGSEEAALKVAAEIAPGQILGVLLKAQNKETILKLDKPENATSWQRVVVLIDGGTAGVAELVAAGLRDSAGAVLVGETTFGDAKHQTLIAQKDGSAVIFTDGKYLTPKRYEFDQKGVSASVKAPPSGDKRDVAIEKALEILSSNAPLKEVASA